MRPAQCLLSLAILAGASCARPPACLAGEQDCSGVTIEAAEYLASFTGLVFISKSLWLETIYSNSSTAAKTGDSIIHGIKIGSNVLLMLAGTRHRQMAPFDFSPIDESLLTGYGAWRIQTTNFLVSLAQSASLFREADPNLGPTFASSLKVFEENAIKFSHTFSTLVPNLAFNVTVAAVGLVMNFEDTIDIFNRQ